MSDSLEDNGIRMERTPASSHSVFVLELVSTGFFGDRVGESFRREGAAMLDAVTEDLRAIPGITADAGVTAAEGDESLLRTVERCAAHSTLIIAPEFDRLLERFCAAARLSGARSLNCDAAGLALGADKWAFARHLTQRQLPTIPTRLVSLDDPPPRFPCVIKPRSGAGSWLVRRVSDAADFRAAAEAFRQARLTEFLCQPYLAGRSYSVAALALPGGVLDVLPVAEQHLSDDGEFRYLGGQIPADLPHNIRVRIQECVANCLRSVPGLNGYVGVDVLLPDEHPREPVLVEWNPRLTTSYIGYRRLCADNIMERLLFPDRIDRPLRFREQSVSFDAEGRCQ